MSPSTPSWSLAFRTFAAVEVFGRLPLPSEALPLAIAPLSGANVPLLKLSNRGVYLSRQGRPAGFPLSVALAPGTAVKHFDLAPQAAEVADVEAKDDLGPAASEELVGCRLVPRPLGFFATPAQGPSCFLLAGPDLRGTEPSLMQRRPAQAPNSARAPRAETLTPHSRWSCLLVTSKDLCEVAGVPIARAPCDVADRIVTGQEHVLGTPHGGGLKRLAEGDVADLAQESLQLTPRHPNRLGYLVEA